MSGLPLYFYLKKKKIGNPVLANLTFTSQQKYTKTATKICPGCYQIDPSTEDGKAKVEIPPKHILKLMNISKEEYLQGSRLDFFPELRVASQIEEPVYLIECLDSVPRLRKVYEALFGLLKFDTLVLVDGGTDSLMFGDEDELGTPYEDMMNMAAVYFAELISVPRYLLSLGYGLERGIKLEDLERNYARLDKIGGFLGEFPLSLDQEETRKYREIYLKSNPRYSIICAGVCAALEGKFGPLTDSPVEERVEDDRPTVVEKTCSYFLFTLNSVMDLNLYAKKLKEKDDYGILQVIREVENLKKKTPEKKED